MVEKNLFPYNLAVAAIFKNEAPYLKEWLDYHLLAGVEHFYLYNNDSTDNFAEVLAPYVEVGLVTLTNFSGRLMQMPAYNNAIERYRHECRYMAFIDLDEFIFPKTGGNIVEVLDEIFSRDEKIAAVGINWQIFGSNGNIVADYSRGVLERFTRRAPKDWIPSANENPELSYGNSHIKSIVNPRRTNFFPNPHYAVYFHKFRAVNENGQTVEAFFNKPVTAEKIVVNHYYTKSHEENTAKMARGRSDILRKYSSAYSELYDRNEEFDDGILHYRAARADIFAIESNADKVRRVEKNLAEILTQCSPFDAPPEFFVGKLETFLTCRALAEKFGTKIGTRSAEEFALVWIYQTLIQRKERLITEAELQLFMSELPELLARPFPMSGKILQITKLRIIPVLSEIRKIYFHYEDFVKLNYIQRLLNLL